MRPAVFFCAAVLAAAACAPGQVTPPPRAGDRPGAPDPSDTCGASRLQYLIGRPKSEIPVPTNPQMRRVTCTTCPITMDYSPQRLNILFDQATGIVREVRCG